MSDFEKREMWKIGKGKPGTSFEYHSDLISVWPTGWRDDHFDIFVNGRKSNTGNGAQIRKLIRELFSGKREIVDDLIMIKH